MKDITDLQQTLFDDLGELGPTINGVISADEETIDLADAVQDGYSVVIFDSKGRVLRMGRL